MGWEFDVDVTDVGAASEELVKTITTTVRYYRNGEGPVVDQLSEGERAEVGRAIGQAAKLAGDLTAGRTATIHLASGKDPVFSLHAS